MSNPNKIGRPTDNPKNIQLHVRLDRECEEIINKYCDKYNVSKMEAARRGIKKLKTDVD